MQNELKLSEDELPLFPLHVVLFPGAILPLHIFEQRYRLMIQFCLDNERPFGVVLIKEGHEVGDPAEPFLVGTSVEIVEVDRLQDGRMNLITLGKYRFEVLDITQYEPYLVGKVSVPDIADVEADEKQQSLAAKASNLYQDYESLLEKLIPGWEKPQDIPSSPSPLSYQIGARLQIPLEETQQLLETLPIDELLTREIEILERENRQLKIRIIAQSN
ncbi:MAG: LON peptidase substrate-binding domain-containing protein [Candidatus Poribacteria bacterium]|nr:LON peptidase substrate-binding domain-containing protein [Candidatus Poribacteria bacterium]